MQEAHDKYMTFFCVFIPFYVHYVKVHFTVTEHGRSIVLGSK